MTNQKTLTVANEILRQLGGRRFQIMTGSNSFRGDDSSLTMNLKRNKARAKYLTIKLTSMDDYTLTWYNNKAEVIAIDEGIFCNMLQDVFTERTGIYTIL